MGLRDPEAEQMIPYGPLLENVGLVIGVLSYNGKFTWGFNADYDRLPDLIDFRVAIENAFERLAAAAGVELGAAPELVAGAEPPCAAAAGLTASQAAKAASMEISAEKSPPTRPA